MEKINEEITTTTSVIIYNIVIDTMIDIMKKYEYSIKTDFLDDLTKTVTQKLNDL
jgi:hypothetical protein